LVLNVLNDGRNEFGAEADHKELLPVLAILAHKVSLPPFRLYRSAVFADSTPRLSIPLEGFADSDDRLLLLLLLLARAIDSLTRSVIGVGIDRPATHVFVSLRIVILPGGNNRVLLSARLDHRGSVVTGYDANSVSFALDGRLAALGFESRLNVAILNISALLPVPCVDGLPHLEAIVLMMKLMRLGIATRRDGLTFFVFLLLHLHLGVPRLPLMVPLIIVIRRRRALSPPHPQDLIATNGNHDLGRRVPPIPFAVRSILLQQDEAVKLHGFQPLSNLTVRRFPHVAFFFVFLRGGGRRREDVALIKVAHVHWKFLKRYCQ
jgi:hypothetical protein